MGGDVMYFDDTFEEFINSYKFKDSKEYYTNGSEIIQVFRVMQAWEHYSQQLKDKHSKDVIARNRTIINLYILLLRFLPDLNSAEITVDTINTLNQIYKDIDDFQLQNEIDEKLVKL